MGEHQHHWHINVHYVKNFHIYISVKSRDMAGMGHLWFKWVGHLWLKWVVHLWPKWVEQLWQNELLFFRRYAQKNTGLRVAHHRNKVSLGFHTTIKMKAYIPKLNLQPNAWFVIGSSLHTLQTIYPLPQFLMPLPTVLLLLSITSHQVCYYRLTTPGV